jgi:hypothetical protein
MEFVYSERIQDRIYEVLTRTNTCGKGRMAFPHWPPTSFEEARALFETAWTKGIHIGNTSPGVDGYSLTNLRLRNHGNSRLNRKYIREIRERCGIQFDDFILERHQRTKADCQRTNPQKTVAHLFMRLWTSPGRVSSSPKKPLTKIRKGAKG